MQWLASAALITAFDIKPVMKDGRPVIPSENFQDGIIRYVSFSVSKVKNGCHYYWELSFPEPFEYVIAPRSKLSKLFL